MFTPEIDQLITQALKKSYQYYQNKDYANAEELYRQILRVDSNNKEALEIGGLTLSQNGKHKEGKSWLDKTIALDGNNYRFWNNIGLVHGSLGEHEEAISCFKKAIQLNSSQVHLYVNLALELKKTGDYDQVFDILERCVENHSCSEHVYFNYGAIVHEIGMFDKAISLYEKALELKMDFPVCHYNLSSCLFLIGQYEKAWNEYEWRWKQFERFEKVRSRFKVPYWNGQELNGKKIVLYCEQGAGDTLMCLRFIPILQSMGANVILECINPLIDLINTCADHVCEQYDGQCDYHCSLLTVPGVLGIDQNNIPDYYISSNGLLISEEWKKYDVFTKVGICWTGNPMHPNDRNRSCKLSYFSELSSIPNFRLFSLQKDIRPHVYPDIGVVDYTANSNDVKFIDLSEHLTDFNKTATVIENMDVIVTVDTCIAHLSNLLGQKVHLMLPYVPDWRWGLESSTPWYKNVIIHRQKNIGDWESVFDEINSIFK